MKQSDIGKSLDPIAHLVLSFILHADRKPEKENYSHITYYIMYASVHNSKTNFSILQKTNNCEVGVSWKLSQYLRKIPAIGLL
jgi:hypothetical protein